MNLISMIQPLVWKDIRGFEGYYQISNYGDVRSLDRTITDSVGHTYMIYGRIMKPNKIAKGYYAVHLMRNGKVHSRYIHQLVAQHFCIWYPENHGEYVSNHINGNKLDNYSENLEWCTYSENNIHAYQTGLKPKGEGFYNASLTNEQVREIRDKYNTHSAFSKIAGIYNVRAETIRSVLRYKTYRDI